MGDYTASALTSLPNAPASTLGASCALGATDYLLPHPSLLTRTRSQPGPCREVCSSTSHSAPSICESNCRDRATWFTERNAVTLDELLGRWHEGGVWVHPFVRTETAVADDRLVRLA
jgi:hypothetical protein